MTTVDTGVDRARFTHAVHSEWTKLRSLRSTILTLMLSVALGIGFGALLSFAGARGQLSEPQDTFDPTLTSLQGFMLAQLAVGVLGVLAVTSEYATGSMRTTLAAVPHRGRLLAAKALVFGVVALLVGELIGFGSFALGQTVLGSQGIETASLSDPAVAQAVIGTGLYLAAIALLGVALGVLVRSTAGALALIVAITLLIPVISTALPASWAGPIYTYWPTRAGTQIMTVVPDSDALTPWQGFGLLAGTIVVLLGVAWHVLRRRDA